MRRATALIIFAIVGCHQHWSPAHPLGWQYSSEGYANGVIYGFGDTAETHFVGICDRVPIFVLGGGDYPLGTDHFLLNIDGRRSVLNAFQGAHGRAFIMDQPDIVGAIVNARRNITFQVGAWQRELHPGVILQRFFSECLARRKVDPDAVRWFNSAKLVPAKGRR